jgi:hypothetical protein
MYKVHIESYTLTLFLTIKELQAAFVDVIKKQHRWNWCDLPLGICVRGMANRHARDTWRGAGKHRGVRRRVFAKLEA